MSQKAGIVLSLVISVAGLLVALINIYRGGRGEAGFVGTEVASL
jgi:hypothetical protein